MAELNPSAARVRQLEARVAELEALVEARTSTILGLAAELAEHQGSTTAFAAARLAAAEQRVTELEATRLFRYTAAPRWAYGRLRRG